ncbi:uncharacterized protein LOC125650180 [Ostrea edulis]|uniref:uncharacterized protein LOC125650180 n=1 Tax=Ostrea edulis TaxID=37623 RepID=UPI0020956B4B|nr:uncharacterized protein LOC125650180 [Ostrea edulis]XP_056021892.1 uncharacterized protein LOC125650180 [Ostrea edulis]
MQSMQIKAEKQDTGYSVATGYQPSPALPSQNGGPPSHPSQLTSTFRHIPPQLYSAYGQVPGQHPQSYPQGGQPPFYPPPATASVAQVSQPSGEQEEEKLKISENQIDFSSVKGIFGWTTVDGVNVPYIFRKDKQFVSVRIVEQKLLSKYPNSYPDELGKHQPLTSYFITGHEAKLLNEINTVHCGGEFGQKLFNSKDLIVLLEDFVDFYNLVKKTFPEAKQGEHNGNSSVALPPMQSMQVNLKLTEDSNEPCGWIQVNNTVTPYVRREALGKFVPLSVMKYAAALSIPEKGVLPSEEECDLLNKACKLAGFNFTFSMTTRIICLTDILKHCQVHIMELPMENPLQHAQYLDLPSSTPSTSQNSESSSTSTSVSGQTQMSQSSPQAVRQDISEITVVPTDKQLPHEQNTHYPPTGAYMGPPYPYMDPRYVFTYNRHPMYPVNYGPPNVTVNQPHGFPPGTRPPYQNGHFPPGQQNSRYPSQDQMRPSRSPIRSPSANIPSSSVNNRVSPSAGGRPRGPISNGMTSPSMYHPPHMNTRMPAPDMQGYNMGGRPRGSVGRSPYPPRGSPSNRMPNTNNMHGFPFVPNYPLPQMVTSNQQGQGMTMRAKTVNIPPPPNMSGPHQAPRQPSSRVPPQSLPNGHLNQTAPPPGSSQKNSDLRVNGVPANTSTPQPQDRNVTQNGQNQAKNKTSPPALVESIKGVWLAGKSISCMHLDRPGRQGKFCLVEAVCKLYFNGCSVNEFLYALENVLKVPLVTCTDEEEKSFIHYYSLPVSVLKCNKMINYKDLDEYFPQLSYVFREKTGSNGESQSQTSNSNKTNSAKGEDLSRKRHLSANSGPIGKQPCRRLEATVQRLMSQQESQIIEPTNKPNMNGESSGGAVIILD